MTPEQALALPRYQRIRVRPSGRKLWRRALVTQPASRAGRWVILSYALIREDRGAGAEVLSRHDHVAVIGQDAVEVIG